MENELRYAIKQLKIDNKILMTDINKNVGLFLDHKGRLSLEKLDEFMAGLMWCEIITSSEYRYIMDIAIKLAEF